MAQVVKRVPWAQVVIPVALGWSTPLGSLLHGEPASFSPSASLPAWTLLFSLR